MSEEWTTSANPDDTYQRGFATHECVGKNGVTLRSGVEMSSSKLGLIPRHALVVVDETKSASDGTVRCRLAPPNSGWCSAKVLVEMLQNKRRAVDPRCAWASDAWVPTVVEMSALNKGGHSRAKFPVTVVLPKGCPMKKPKEQNRWPLMAIFAGEGAATASPLCQRLAKRLQVERHVPSVFLDYEGQGTAKDAPPPDGASDFAHDDMRGAVKWALNRADQLLLIGTSTGAQLLPGVTNAMKESRKRVRAAVSIDYGANTPSAAAVASLQGKKGPLTPNDKHKELRSYPRLYVGTSAGSDDRMALIDLINGSTDDSQVDMVDGDDDVVKRAFQWIAKQKRRPWMPWDVDPDDTDDEEDNE